MTDASNGSVSAGSASNPQPKHDRIEMIVYGVLIEHTTAGLLLFETGCHDDMEKYWGPVGTLPCLPSVNHGMTASGC